MKTILINSSQEHFLKCACNLHQYVLDFSVSDKDFKDCYGYTKKQAKIGISQLYNQLKEKK